MKITKNVSTEDVKIKAQEVGQQIADQASTAAESGKAEVAAFLGDKKEDAVHTVRDLDQALRRTAEQVDNPGMGRMIESLAGEVDRLASTLEKTEFDDLVHSVDRFSRQNTTLFLAGSFALGMAAARFLRSSGRPELNSGPLYDRPANADVF